MRSKFLNRSSAGRLLVLLVVAAVVAVLWVFQVPCVWKTLFGFPCPGCGMTRAFLALLRLDFVAAWSFHPMVFVIPFAVLFFLAEGPLISKKVDRVFWWLVAAGFLVNWIIQLVLLTR